MTFFDGMTLETIEIGDSPTDRRPMCLRHGQYTACRRENRVDSVSAAEEGGVSEGAVLLATRGAAWARRRRAVEGVVAECCRVGC